MSHKEISIWKRLSENIVHISRSADHGIELAAKILEELKCELNLTRATVLFCQWKKVSKEHEVTGLTYPPDKYLKSARTSNMEFRLLGRNLILDEAVTKNCMEGEKGREGQLTYVKIFWVVEQGTKNQFILIISRTGKVLPDALKPHNNAEIYNLLSILGNFYNQYIIDSQEEKRSLRRTAVSRILSAHGDLSLVSEKLCNAWRQFLNAGAIRLWIYVMHNKKHLTEQHNEFEEYFDLLDYTCDQGDLHLVKDLYNQIPNQKCFTLTEIKENNIVSIENLSNNTEWLVTNKYKALAEKWPALICIPLTIPKNPDDEISSSKLVGILDVHLETLEEVSQDDFALLYLAKCTAISLQRSHLYEFWQVTNQLNKCDFDLSTPGKNTRVGDRKDKYVENIKKLLLDEFKTKSASIYEKDEDEDEDKIRCIATTGLFQRQDDGTYQKMEKYRNAYYKKGEGLTRKVFDENRTIILNDLCKSPWFRGKYAEIQVNKAQDNYLSWLATPLRASSGKIGVIRILNKQVGVNKSSENFFTDHDIEKFNLIATRVGPVLQMLRIQQQRESELNNQKLISTLTNRIYAIMDIREFRKELAAMLAAVNQEFSVQVSYFLSSIQDPSVNDYMLEARASIFLEDQNYSSPYKGAKLRGTEQSEDVITYRGDPAFESTIKPLTVKMLGELPDGKFKTHVSKLLRRGVSDIQNIKNYHISIISNTIESRDNRAGSNVIAFFVFHSEITENKAQDISTWLMQISEKTHIYFSNSQLYADRKVFLEDTSHQLVTPLINIARTANFLLSKSKNSSEIRVYEKKLEEVKKRIDEIRQLARSAVFSVKTFTEEASDDNFDSPFSELGPTEAINLTQLMINVGSNFRRPAQALGLTIKTEEEQLDAFGEYEGDRDSLWNALYNIVDNAVKYSKPESRSTILLEGRKQSETREDKRAIGLSVTNFSPARLSKPHKMLIFKRGFRAPQAEDLHVQGTGLGLAIAQEVAQTHGGKLTVEQDNKLKYGGFKTTFTIWLPIQ